MVDSCGLDGLLATAMPEPLLLGNGTSGNGPGIPISRYAERRAQVPNGRLPSVRRNHQRDPRDDLGGLIRNHLLVRQPLDAEVCYALPLPADQDANADGLVRSISSQKSRSD